MGILLTFMFVVNMVGAIILLPAMARCFWRHNHGPTAAPSSMRK
jgi:predicted RND superfamily exporter protein